MQLVGYEPSGRGSALLLAEDGDLTRQPLSVGTELAYALGERRCAGVITDGIHRSCDRDGTPYCGYHTSTWVCARCTGTCLKPEMDCDDEHAIYIAAFAPDTFKVGVTKTSRLETRLREQGADRAAHIDTVPNGRIAREREAAIAEWLVDRVRTGPKVASLATTVEETAWADTLCEFTVIDHYTFDYGLDLANQPIRETLANGTVRGVKGRLLVLETEATTYVVDMRDLLGYDLLKGTPRTDRQTSLGSFG